MSSHSIPLRKGKRYRLKQLYKRLFNRNIALKLVSYFFIVFVVSGQSLALPPPSVPFSPGVHKVASLEEQLKNCTSCLSKVIVFSSIAGQYLGEHPKLQTGLAYVLFYGIGTGLKGLGLVAVPAAGQAAGFFILGCAAIFSVGHLLPGAHGIDFAVDTAKALCMPSMIALGSVAGGGKAGAQGALELLQAIKKVYDETIG